MAKFLRDNGLTIVLTLLFLGSFVGQWLTGVRFQNEELIRHGGEPVSALAFLTNVEFLSTVFENWESEFLQMGAYVVLTAILFQRGSAESKDPDENPRDVDEKSNSPGVPSPLKRGPVLRWLYERSLGLVLFLLFVISFGLHWLFSAKSAAQAAAAHGERPEPLLAYILKPQLWFESFQNWQSEFLSASVLVVLSIWLRQKNSPESKPVDAPHSQTGT